MDDLPVRPPVPPGEPRTFTLEQVKAAFWAMFHRSGESWFDYLGTEDEAQASTASEWDDFEEKLKAAASPAPEGKEPR